MLITSKLKSLVAVPLSLAMIALMSFAGLLVSAPAANAVPQDYRIGYKVTVDGYTKTLGTLAPRDQESDRLICIDSQWDDPNNLPGATTATNAKLAYLMEKYTNTSDDATAAALAEVVKEDLDRSQDWRKKVWNAFKAKYSDATVKKVTDKMASMKTEASKYAGPYSLVPTLAVNESTGKGTATFGIKTGNTTTAYYYAGVGITLTLAGTGNARWDTNGSTTVTVTSTTALQTLAWTAQGPGIVTVSADTPDSLPSTKFHLYSPSGNLQDMVSPITSNYDVNGTASLTWSGSFPALSSSVGAKSYAKVGDTLTDAVTVDAEPAFAGQTVTVNTTIYGPLSAPPTGTSPSAPAGTPVFQTLTTQVTLNSAGDAVANFTSKATTAEGYYVWKESTQVAGTLQPASSSYGRTTEEASVFTPTVATQISEQNAKVGDRISDTAIISGWKSLPNPVTPLSAVLSGKLLGPVAPNLAGTCTALNWTGAPTAYTVPNQAITGDRTLTGIGAFTVLRSGCYTYTYTLTGTSGGNTVWTVNHAPGQVTQTALIEPRTGINSHVGTVVALPNKALVDNVQVTGVPQGTEVTVHGALYGPLATLPASETADVPVGTPLVGTWTTKGTADADETIDVSFTSDPVTETGYYVWVESSDAVDLVPDMVGTFGRKAETSLVMNPATVATQVSQQDSKLGDTLVDTVTVTGVDQLLAFTPTASVEINGKLYGPVEPVNGVCTSVDWTGAPTSVAFNDLAVTKDGDLTGVGSHMVVKPGCYSYGETMTARVGDDVLFTVSHNPGRVSQTSLAPVPTMVTTVSHTSGDLGLVINDAIVVEGFTSTGISADTRIIASLRGPLLPVDDKCEQSAADWMLAIQDDKNGLEVGKDQELVITGNGTYTTADVTLNKPGCYTWIESLRVNGVEITTTPPGLVSETTRVYPPTVVTTTSDQVVGDNAEVVDTVEITHMGGKTGTMIAQLYGPYILDAQDADGNPKLNTDGTPVDAETLDCSSISPADWQARIDSESGLTSSDPETITVTGDGTYVTSKAVIAAAGCYTWAETLTVGDPADPDIVVLSAPGQVSETTLAITPRITTVAVASSALAGAKLTDKITIGGLHNQAATITGKILGPVTVDDSILNSKTIFGAAKCIGLTWTVEDKQKALDEAFDAAVKEGQADAKDKVDWTTPENVAKLATMGLDWTSAPVLADIEPIKVTASGDSTTKGIRTPNTKDGEGCYTFVETITPDDTSVAPFTTNAGLRDETVFLTKPVIPTGLVGDMNLGALSAAVSLLVAAALLLFRRRTA